VELAEHAVPQQRLKAFDGVGVNVTIHVLILMLDDGVEHSTSDMPR